MRPPPYSKEQEKEAEAIFKTMNSASKLKTPIEQIALLKAGTVILFRDNKWRITEPPKLHGVFHMENIDPDATETCNTIHGAWNIILCRNGFEIISQPDE